MSVGAPFTQWLTAEPAAAASCRRQLRYWLASLSWPAQQSDELLLAVSEAVSNSIEHGYPSADPADAILVSGEQVLVAGDQRQLLITVADQGRWRPTPVETQGRRRGIPLMRALTETVDIAGTGSGTWVTMRSHAVPAAVEPAARHLVSAHGGSPLS